MIMNYYIITETNWAKLRDEILSLAAVSYTHLTLPITQIGHKCYYKREDVETLLLTKSNKPKNRQI